MSEGLYPAFSSGRWHQQSRCAAVSGILFRDTERLAERQQVLVLPRD